LDDIKTRGLFDSKYLKPYRIRHSKPKLYASDQYVLQQMHRIDHAQIITRHDIKQKDSQ